MKRCPKCGAEPFEQFLPRFYFSWWRRLLRLPYLSVICRGCKGIVGHER